MILRAESVQKRFERRWVLRDASLALDPGEIVLLMGANGSGKTTFAQIVATLLQPDRGSIRFEGEPLEKRRQAARRRIGFASHRPLLYLGLSPLENLAFFGRLAGVRDPERRALGLLDRFRLSEFARTPIERFSRGMLQRVALSRAFLAAPRLLVLDEPYAGLDDEGSATLNAMLTEAKADGAATLVISHDTERLGALRTRLCRMEEGRVVERGA
ncbi:MAG: ABC transporter ATP-binding protein [Hyphomicrobiales bacterium]